MRTPDPRTTDPTDQHRLRMALGRFATGVAVVTARSRSGMPVGMTVNSFTSVSLDPPLVLFCASRRSSLYPVFAAADAFGVNILRESQIAESRRFASRGFDRFATLRPRTGRTGVPLLPRALATLECVEPRRLPAGDHDVLIGRVAAIEADPDEIDQPLVYYAGGYRSLNTDFEWWSAWRE
ncbi:FMN reductase [Actinomadura rubrobrunea]|uniref:FMN reductase n=1 Tax=Actinomadura rubrobrunea TaxID=115335 RepID=A0A9W6PUB8_9ACTN|nr:flavin reductase family protein [Actinomadura rubrobrunea]GLW63915.1 FMN reductase [Actinomadura rubrobrunea]